VSFQRCKSCAEYCFATFSAVLLQLLRGILGVTCCADIVALARGTDSASIVDIITNGTMSPLTSSPANALRNIHLVLLTLLVFTCVSVTAQETKIEPKPKIGGIALGFKRNDVEKRLGKPIKVITTDDALDPELRYDGLTIWFWADTKRVEQIISTSPKYCLTINVCPGADASAVQKVLGPPRQKQSIQDGKNNYGLSNADTCWLNVIVEREIVTSLEIRCQP
jgi:hypothetical protein